MQALPLVQGLAQCTKRLNGPKIARKFCKKKGQSQYKIKERVSTFLQQD